MPSMHEVVTGFYQPNSFDLTNGNPASFGTTTNILTQGTECGQGGDETTMAARRASEYQSYCTLFGIDAGENLGCANAQPFTSDSSSYFPTYWFTGSATENECELTSSLTGYSLWATRDYMRCVCDTWGQDVTDCLTEVPDPTTGSAITSFVFSSATLITTLLLTAMF